MAGHIGRARGEVHDLSVADLGLLADQVAGEEASGSLAQGAPGPQVKGQGAAQGWACS